MKFSNPLSQKDLDLMLSEPSFEKIKQKYPDLLTHIEMRLGYIVEFIAKEVGDGYSWFDFDNFSETRSGYFDPARYKDNIGIHIKFDRQPKYTCEIFTNIPFSYLTGPMEQDVACKIKKAIEEDSIQRQRAIEFKKTEHIRVNRLIESIKTKLTEEELAIIHFKKVK